MHVLEVNCLLISCYSVYVFVLSIIERVRVFECVKHVIIRVEYAISMEGESLLRHVFNMTPPR